MVGSGPRLKDQRDWVCGERWWWGEKVKVEVTQRQSKSWKGPLNKKVNSQFRSTAIWTGGKGELILPVAYLTHPTSRPNRIGPLPLTLLSLEIHTHTAL